MKKLKRLAALFLAVCTAVTALGCGPREHRKVTATQNIVWP